MRIGVKIQIRIGIVLMHTAYMYIVIKIPAIYASIYVSFFKFMGSILY
jgi:hypothetical protein